MMIEPNKIQVGDATGIYDHLLNSAVKTVEHNVIKPAEKHLQNRIDKIQKKNNKIQKKNNKIIAKGDQSPEASQHPDLNQHQFPGADTSQAPKVKFDTPDFSSHDRWGIPTGTPKPNTTVSRSAQSGPVANKSSAKVRTNSRDSAAVIARGQNQGPQGGGRTGFKPAPSQAPRPQSGPRKPAAPGGNSLAVKPL